MTAAEAVTEATCPPTDTTDPCLAETCPKMIPTPCNREPFKASMSAAMILGTVWFAIGFGLKGNVVSVNVSPVPIVFKA